MLNGLYTLAWMTLIELFRRRIIPILLVVVPTIFFLVTWFTTKDQNVLFKLVSISDEEFIQVSMRSEGMVFMGLAAIGVLSAFLSMTLIQRNQEANRRLIVCGTHPVTLALSKLLIMFGIMIAVSLYILIILLVLIDVIYPFKLALGLLLLSLIYGSFGLLVGTLLKGELEGILAVVLLANIDVGWLQNPIFYAAAKNELIIKCLPAFFPSQYTMAAAFSEIPVANLGVYSVFYACSLLLIACSLFWLKMKIHR